MIDAHFLYPDGYAATRIGRRLGLPVTITLRGSKDQWLIGTDREPMLREALNARVHLIAVSEALKRDVGRPARVSPIEDQRDRQRRRPGASSAPVDRAEARRAPRNRAPTRR